MSPAVPRTLSHLDARGRVRMVDVGPKRVTRRTAVARGRVFMHRDTLQLLQDGRTPKGDVIATAHIAGVMAAKRTSEIVPLAHQLPIDDIDHAKLVPDWDAVMKGRSGVGNAPPIKDFSPKRHKKN